MKFDLKESKRNYPNQATNSTMNPCMNKTNLKGGSACKTLTIFKEAKAFGLGR